MLTALLMLWNYFRDETDLFLERKEMRFLEKKKENRKLKRFIFFKSWNVTTKVCFYKSPFKWNRLCDRILMTSLWHFLYYWSLFFIRRASLSDISRQAVLTNLDTLVQNRWENRKSGAFKFFWTNDLWICCWQWMSQKCRNKTSMVYTVLPWICYMLRFFFSSPVILESMCRDIQMSLMRRAKSILLFIWLLKFVQLWLITP